MLVSKKWLDSMVAIPDDIKAFCDRLDLTGTGVEGISRVGANLDGIYVGHILTRERHPESDHLWVTTVDLGQANVGKDGTPEVLQIVCGAQNFEAGDKVPVATVGTTMPDGNKIKKSKLRGVVSCGMNCSGRELGISNDHEGLLILPEDAPVGAPIAEYLGMTDTVIDLEITPNRPDCLSMRGMAREVGAMYDTDYTVESFDLVEGEDDVDNYVTVDIADPELCPRYTARIIKNVKVGPSPEWLAERVTAAGARSINNLVDITNYILFSLGQPLHAFDYDKLPKGEDGKVHITVRAAADGEPFTTLDEVDRTLTSDMAVIDAGGTPVALAGVMGGLDTEITEETTTVLLEAATFSPAHTSRTSRNLTLMSESSLRYERGVDDNTCEENSAQAAALIADLAGGEVCKGVADCYPGKTEPIQLTFRYERFCKFIGADVPKADCENILRRLGCEVSESGDDLSVVAPTFRPDLEREIDLYEEVLRLWGMERVAPTLPGGRERIGGRTPYQIKLARIGETLRACGLNETTTYSLVPADDLERLRMSAEGRGEAVELLNPMSSEQSVMRQTIIPGLLRSVAHNQNRGVANVQLYESGKVFFAAEGRKKPREKELLAGVLVGSWGDAQWNDPAVELGFFDAKGVIETLLREMAVRKVHFKVLEGDAATHLQPGRAAAILAGGSQLGWVGEIHPLVLADFDVTGPVAAFELDMAALVKVSEEMRDYQEVPRFPSVDMDLALVVDEAITAETLVNAIENAGGKLLESARLFDVYRDDEKIGAGKKSLAFALTYRSPDKTLTSEAVENQHERLVKKVCSKTGAEVRG